jgi:O-phosphoseryl-tRNA synthetase
MKKLDTQEILARVRKEGFEKVWADGNELLRSASEDAKIIWPLKGKSHPVVDTAELLRQGFLKLGFNETINPFVVEEEEIYKQYGPEAPIILDRCYYLATLPRPDIGLGKDRCQKIEELGVELDRTKITNLQTVLRNYKKGNIAADDLVEEVTKKLHIPDEKALQIIREVFLEFTTLKPVSTNLTVRSHMTSAWFETLKALQHKVELPIKLFSIGLRLRREQTEDQTHLRAHTVASCVVMGPEATVERGKLIASNICNAMNFEEVRFENKEITPKYYAPGTDHECFVHQKSADRWVEVLELGLYSPVALANYGLEYPVLNIGLGVERMTMLLRGEKDIRKLVYPQFHKELVLTDEELARAVQPLETPQSKLGERVKDAIIDVAMKNAEARSPCEFKVFEEGNLTVYVYEPDPNTKLLGPAALNTIYAYDGNLLGIPERGMEHVTIVKEAREKGITTNIRYLEAVASQAASQIEKMLYKEQTDDFSLRVRMAKLPSDINIRISDVAERYITGKKKKIDIRGPVFIGIRATLRKV